MASSNPPPTILKTYKLVYISAWSARRREIHLDTQPIYAVNTERRFMRPPRVILSSAAAGKEEVLGMVKLNAFSTDLSFQLGSGGGADDAGLQPVNREGWSSSTYFFTANGRQFRWTRTHDSALGASRLGGRDFKLVDVASGQVLMTHIFRQSVFGRMKHVADLNFYVELGGGEVEVAALLAMLGIEAQIQARSSGAAGGAAGGGGGGA